jgi:hypothetical protein
MLSPTARRVLKQLQIEAVTPPLPPSAWALENFAAFGLVDEPAFSEVWAELKQLELAEEHTARRWRLTEYGHAADPDDL